MSERWQDKYRKASAPERPTEDIPRGVPVEGDSPPTLPATAETLPAEIPSELPSFLGSIALHLLVLVTLGLLIQRMPSEGPRGADIHAAIGDDGSSGGGNQDPLEVGDTLATKPQSDADDMPLATTTADAFAMLPQLTTDPTDSLHPTSPVVPDAAAGGLLANMPLGKPGRGGGNDPNGLGVGPGDEIGPGGLGGRFGAAKARGLADGGGTPESEAAVERALAWLAEHQNYNGSWTYDFGTNVHCKHHCANEGAYPEAVNAATAMGLLPFLGAGHTQKVGRYRENVDRGIHFLLKRLKYQSDMASFYEPGGRMYSHGLASIALCEAYGMTHDSELKKPAQAVLNFIVTAQDRRGGGWRYEPRQAGDTSVVGWQLMALRSGQLSYLLVPRETLRRADYFLDSVEDLDGGRYGYETRGTGGATTAIGLLGRMFLGHPKDEKNLVQGVLAIAQAGPSTFTSEIHEGMYYNYYATQVMHHYGGSEWKRWNEVMREFLIRSQSRQGHEEGSWFFDISRFDTKGGRLYCTALAAMTLEVYYRYSPIYSSDSVQIK